MVLGFFAVWEGGGGWEGWVGGVVEISYYGREERKKPS